MDNPNCNSQSCSSGVGNPSGVGTGSDAVDETQDEEPSSSSSAYNDLESFRLQWKREIEQSPSKEKKSQRKIQNNCTNGGETVEEKAKAFFLRGIQAERLGKLQDAIAFYRRAIQLVPDIELRIEENMEDYFNEYFEESSDESDLEENCSDSEDEIDNLINKFQKIAVKTGTSRICQPKHDQKTSHISCLPPEIFLYILKWVVSLDLDVLSLERLSKVCRGFYLCARDNEIWRLICMRTWDMNLDNPNRFGNWRNMYIERPHLSFNGVYISKTTYVRYGETSFQDTNYRPCYLVEYYRYLRFFPDGNVLMLTTPEDPYQSLYKLRYPKTKHQNIMSGRFILVANTVMAVLRKPKSENNSANYYNRFRRQRQANLQETTDQTFHLELQLKNVKKRINCQLTWNRYSIHMVNKNGEEVVSNFEIVPSNFPSFWFSRVKSFTAESESALE